MGGTDSKGTVTNPTIVLYLPEASAGGARAPPGEHASSEDIAVYTTLLQNGGVFNVLSTNSAKDAIDAAKAANTVGFAAITGTVGTLDTAAADTDKNALFSTAALTPCDHLRHLLELCSQVRVARRDLFQFLLGPAANTPGVRLLACDDTEVNMASDVHDHIALVLNILASELPREAEHKGNPLSCPMCGKGGMGQFQLWRHCNTYHINQKKNASLHEVRCPLCPELRSREPFLVHFHDSHAPPGTHIDNSRGNVAIVSFGLTVIQRKSDKKFLVVQEYCNQGYWLPGGGIDSGEFPTTAAIREAKEEAGVDVELTGVLRVECTPPRGNRGYMRMRYIFFGHPKDEAQPAKSFPDFESVGAAWVTVDEITSGKLKLRGDEPLEWFQYVANGGPIMPMSFLTYEGAPVQMPPS